MFSKLLTVTMGIAVVLLAFGSPAYAGDTPEKVPAPDEFVEIDVMPEVIQRVSPVYPAEAKKAGIEGSVWVKVLVNIHGDIVDALLAKTSGYEAFDQSALEAAKKSKYKPAQQKGQPVAVWITYEIRFHLKDKPDDFIEGESMPEVIQRVSPVYPAEAKKAGIEGNVWVKALVDINGNILDAVVAKSSGVEAFDQSALEAAKKSKFKPAQREGQPVAVWITYEIQFRLKNDQ